MTACWPDRAWTTAAILACTPGITSDVATDWQHFPSGDWTSYTAEVIRRTSIGTHPSMIAKCRSPPPAA
jgi:hypothetical protein